MLRSNEIRELFRGHMGENADILLAPFDDFFRRLDRSSLPNQGESAAIALTCPKTAALCYDRVWSGLGEQVPEGIGFRGYSAPESGLLFLWALTAALQDAGPRAQNFYEEAGRQFAEALGYDSMVREETIDRFARKLAEGVASEHGIAATTIFGEQRDRDLAYQEGDRTAIVAIIREIPVVAEDNLTWEQVIEFRRDVEMLRRFRKLVHWLDTSMIGRSHRFILDEVTVRFDEYASALRKHGIKTKLGLLSAVLDRDAMITAAATTVTLGYLTDTWTALMSGAAVLGGQMILQIATMRLNYDEVTASSAGEISYLVELKKRTE